MKKQRKTIVDEWIIERILRCKLQQRIISRVIMTTPTMTKPLLFDYHVRKDSLSLVENKNTHCCFSCKGTDVHPLLALFLSCSPDCSLIKSVTQNGFLPSNTPRIVSFRCHLGKCGSINAESFASLNTVSLISAITFWVDRCVLTWPGTFDTCARTREPVHRFNVSSVATGSILLYNRAFGLFVPSIDSFACRPGKELSSELAQW